MSKVISVGGVEGKKFWVYVNGGTCPEPPGTARNQPDPPGTPRNLPGTLKKAQMIKFKKKTNNKK